MNIHNFLDQKKVAYETIQHRPTFDAQRLAEAVNESGRHVAKTVLLRSAKDYLLAVLPATHTIDLPGTRALLRTDDVALASEPEINEKFPDCETGAIPPFGSQYALTTLVDESLADAGQIVFEGNTHEEAIRMRFDDFFELEKPVVTQLSYPEGGGESERE